MILHRSDASLASNILPASFVIQDIYIWMVLVPVAIDRVDVDVDKATLPRVGSPSLHLTNYHDHTCSNPSIATPSPWVLR